MGGKPEAMFLNCLHELVKDADKILDIGTPEKFAKELRGYEHLFLKKNYIAAGYNPVMDKGIYNCDYHQDIEQMTFNDNSFDAIICIEVLEHVANPFQAVFEINRVLRTGGKLLLTVPFLSQYHGKSSLSHDHQNYPDYWRFTHEGLQKLFYDYSNLRIIPLDGPIEFRLKQLYLTSCLKNQLIRKIIDVVDKPKLGKATTRHLVFGIK